MKFIPARNTPEQLLFCYNCVDYKEYVNDLILEQGRKRHYSGAYEEVENR